MRGILFCCRCEGTWFGSCLVLKRKKLRGFWLHLLVHSTIFLFQITHKILWIIHRFCKYVWLQLRPSWGRKSHYFNGIAGSCEYLYWVFRWYETVKCMCITACPGSSFFPWAMCSNHVTVVLLPLIRVACNSSQVFCEASCLSAFK